MIYVGGSYIKGRWKYIGMVYMLCEGEYKQITRCLQQTSQEINRCPSLVLTNPTSPFPGMLSEPVGRKYGCSWTGTSDNRVSGWVVRWIGWLVVSRCYIQVLSITANLPGGSLDYVWARSTGWLKDSARSWFFTWSDPNICVVRYRWKVSNTMVMIISLLLLFFEGSVLWSKIIHEIPFWNQLLSEYRNVGT